MKKRLLATTLALCVLLGLMSGCGAEQKEQESEGQQTEQKINYPTRQIEFVIGFSAGSGPDLLARNIADRLSQKWGVPVVVTNKTDGSSVTALKEFISTSKPDGYTVSIANIGDLSLHMAANINPLYSPDDFTYVCQTSKYSMSVTVKADAPYDTFKELSDWVVANPGELRYCAGNMTGISAFATAEWVNAIGGDFKAARTIPITGSSDAAVKIAGGNADVIIGSIAGVLPMVEAGNLKILAMTPEKDPNYPDIPSAEESGVSGLTLGNWNGIVMPAGADEEIVAMWNEAIEEIYSDPEFLETMNNLGAPAVYDSGENWEKVVRDGVESYIALAEEFGLRK